MEGRRMILFLITQELEYLGSELNVLHRNYIVWNCRLTDFIKREYIGIDTMKPEAIVIEQVALENSKDLIEFQNSFPEIKIILIVSKVHQEHCGLLTIIFLNIQYYLQGWH